MAKEMKYDDVRVASLYVCNEILVVNHITAASGWMMSEQNYLQHTDTCIWHLRLMRFP